MAKIVKILYSGFSAFQIFFTFQTNFPSFSLFLINLHSYFFNFQEFFSLKFYSHLINFLRFRQRAFKQGVYQKEGMRIQDLHRTYFSQIIPLLVYTLIAKYAKTIGKNEKCIARYFASLFSLLHFAPGSAFARKVKGFCVYFFAALIKHQIRIKYEKCTVSVLYFMVCFAKTFGNTREMQNTKSVQPGL